MRPMPFDWMEPKVGEAVRGRAEARTKEARRRDVRDRAGILMRLGWAQKAVAARCKRSLEWEHDLGPEPLAASEVNAIVRDVFERG